MPGFSRTQRATMLLAAAICWRLAYADGGPTDARGMSAKPSGRSAAPRPFTSIAQTIRRDPFRPLDVSHSTAGAATPDGASEAFEAVPDILGDTATQPAMLALPTLRGIVVGKNSVAYVSEGSVLRTVTTGDQIGETSVAHIFGDHIELLNGSRLDFGPSLQHGERR
ncbi:MAG: hypothetical protein GIW95_01200 [Candidatus Eremiobacteraeota bacterium]|nr:hypothetical protein [Candidatus Eremiobacteraeota bacterium]